MLGNEPSTDGPPRVVCSKCSCTFLYGNSCLRCEQDTEYHQSLSADQSSHVSSVENEVMVKNIAMGLISQSVLNCIVLSLFSIYC